jgi:hypothetical protein
MFWIAVTGLLVHCIATYRISGTEKPGCLSGGRIISAKQRVMWPVVRLLENIPVLNYEMKIDLCGWVAGRYIKNECGVSDSGTYGHSNAGSDKMQLGVASLTERSRDQISAQRRGFATIYYPYANFSFACSGIWGNYFNLFNRYPGALINKKIAMAVAPLAPSYARIDNYSNDASAFKKTKPPWGRLISAMVGAIGIMWGWYNLRGFRPSITCFYIFLGGCVLLIYGLIIVLPWSISVH